VITVTSIRKTCNACPSQWEGTIDDGRVIYARYRWGTLTIVLGKTLGEALRSPHIYEADLGDDLDGLLSYDQLKHHTARFIRWPEREEQ